MAIAIIMDSDCMLSVEVVNVKNDYKNINQVILIYEKNLPASKEGSAWLGRKKADELGRILTNGA